MIPAELATPDLLKTKVFWNEGSDIMISIHDGKIKILSSSSDYVVNVVMWPSFGYSFLWGTSIYWFVQKTDFEGWSWFKVNNLGLALGMDLKFYSSVAKRFKLKAKVLRETSWGPFCTSPLLPFWIGLKMNWHISVLWKPLKRRSISFIALLPALWK